MKNRLFYKQFTKFFIVGVSAVIVDFVVYYLLTEMIGISNDIGKGCSFLVGSVYTYYFNKRWTWRKKERSDKTMLGRFATIYGISFIGNIFINKLFLSLIPDYLIGLTLTSPDQISNTLIALQADKLIAFFFASAFSAFFNFLGQKLWVFKTKPDTFIER